MDFTKLAVTDTASIHLKDAAGNHLYSDGKPVRITVFGPGSRQYAEVESRQTNRVLKRREENDGKVAVVSPEQRLTEQAEDLAAITLGFEGIEYEGKTGPDLIRSVYADQRLGFIAAQVSKFVGNWGNFNGDSPPN